MALPLIPLLKLIALGSLKLVFLLFGAVFFPIFALRFILGGATGMLLPALDWLEEHDRLDPDRHKAIVEDLDTMKNISFTRKEARHLLWNLIKKMMVNMVATVKDYAAATASLFGRMFK